MVLTVEHDGYTHKYTVTFYYPGDLTFDLGFEKWIDHKNSDAGKTGSYPEGWYAPINAVTSGSKGSYEPQNCSAKSTSGNKTQGEAGAKLSTVYLLTSAEAMPGFLSLSKPTVSVGAYMVFTHTASTLSYGSPITFRNTPDEIQLDYKLEAYNKITGWRFMYNANNGKQINFVLDHIDGDAANNKEENLRLICPNCNSQLDTYKSRNKKSARSHRKKYS